MFLITKNYKYYYIIFNLLAYILIIIKNLQINN